MTTIQGDKSAAVGSIKYDPSYISPTRKFLTRAPVLSILFGQYYRSKDLKQDLTEDQKNLLRNERITSGEISCALYLIVQSIVFLALLTLGKESLSQYNPYLVAGGITSTLVLLSTLEIIGCIDS